MTGIFPNRPAQDRITGRECARGAFAMHPNVAEFRMPLVLDQVMTDFVNQFQFGVECFAEGFGDLLENDQPIQDCIVASGSDRIQVIAIML